MNSQPQSQGAVISIIQYVLLIQEFFTEQNTISNDQGEATPIPSIHQLSHFRFKELQRCYLKISLRNRKQTP